MTAPADDTAVLELRDLVTEFRVGGAWHAAVRGVSLTVRANETLAIVGESGSGKSVTALSVLRLLPAHGARIAEGSILFGGRDLVQLDEDSMAAIRGDAIAMIFQEPMTSLNPTMPIGEQVAESILIHRGVTPAAARAEALRLLKEVKIPSAAARFGDYPHQFSGGMRQRVMIAMALACEPELLIADEPTTALDVTVQAQIMELIADLRRDMGMSVVLITHDLGVVAATADRVAVMYAGRIVESAPVHALLARPSHGYTLGLIRSLPASGHAPQTRLQEITGSVPRLSAPAAACAFAARCTFAGARCAAERPEMHACAADHGTACFEYDAVARAAAAHPLVKAWA